MYRANFTSEHAIAPQATYDASRLMGKSAIITGATSGIGEEGLRKFVGAGAFVTFSGRSQERGAALVSELGETNVAFVKGDARNWEDQVTLFKTSIAKSPSGGIDIVFANAGISGMDDVFQDSPGPEDEPMKPKLDIVEVNLLGLMYTVKLASHYLRRHPNKGSHDGVLIMCASLAGYLDQPGSPQYAASKFGIRGIMRSLRWTAPLQNMRVNVIAPWYIRARIMSAAGQEKLQSKGVVFAELDDAADAILHLASDPTINGRTLAILPREVNNRGYIDLEMDDLDDSSLLASYQKLAVESAVRVDNN